MKKKFDHIVSPEVLETKKFDFNLDQQNQIYTAKLLGKMLRGYFVSDAGETKIVALSIIWGGE